ncbi:hypothetical protein [uncultured Veillonella sp.]|uniref:hypothetical protein n=1 Tax=uncultured Veillonella sp. TaxID=159268 RepID=UPI0026106E1F|nr:hypothetical protein [uncultured Veillonella sp.]
MQFKNRLFPYPTLNRNLGLSEFKEGINFRLIVNDSHDNSINLIEGDEYLILKDVFYEINDLKIIRLIEAGAVKGTLVVECSSTVYRYSVSISKDPIDVKIPINCLNGIVEILAYLTVVANQIDFNNENFVDEYKGYKFTLSKYDTIALDDGFTFNVEFEERDSSSYESIFLIMKNMSEEEAVVGYEIGDTKIRISLPVESYAYYSSLQNTPKLKYILLSSVIFPALMHALGDVKEKLSEESNCYENLKEQYLWLDSIEKSYYEKTNRSLEEALLFQESVAGLAQIILDNPINKSLKNLCKMALSVEE